MFFAGNSDNCQFNQKYIVIHISGTMEQTTQVYLRLRPSKTSQSTFKIDGNSITVKKEQKYDFTHIFEPTATQAEIYEASVRKYVESSNSFTAMSCGASGAGKSYTMIGDSKSPGIIPRALDNIFGVHNVSKEPIIKPFEDSIVILNDDAVKVEKSKREKMFQTGNEFQ